MPEQPANQAEERLQRHARERRERGGDFPLHPATRRLLQGEVTRQFGGAAGREFRGGGASWFSAWRTVSIFCALVVVLGFGAWFVSRQMSPLGMGQNKFAKAEVPASQPAPFFDERKPGQALDEVSRSIAPDIGATKPAAPTPVTAPSVGLRDEKVLVAKDSDQLPGKAGPARARSSLASTAPAESRSDTVLVRKMEFASIENDSLDLAKKSDPAVANYATSGALENSAAGNPLLKQQQSPAAAAESLALNNGAPQNAFRGDAMNKSVSRPIARGGAQQLTDKSGVENNRQQSNQRGFGGGLAGSAGNGATQNINRDGTTAVANDSYFNQQSPPPRDGAVQKQMQNSPRPEAQQQYALNNAAAERRSGASTEIEAAAKEKHSLAPAVLTRFSIEQIGNLMRLTDADGSLYEGTFVSDEPAPPEDRSVTAKGAAVNTMRMKREAPAPRRLAFRVTGTNRTLNQVVVVNGTFSSSVPAGAAGSFTELSADKKSQNRGAAAQVLPATPSIPTMTPAGTTRVTPSDVATATASTTSLNSVEGTVRIGASTERPFKAVRVIR